MERAIAILMILTLKNVLAYDIIQKVQMKLYNVTQDVTAETDEIRESVHWRHAQSANCQKCGESNGETFLIGGGLKVKPANKYPWMVYLIRGKTEESSICGGALISEDFILTAAHCCLEQKTGRAPHSIEIYFTTRFLQDVTRGPAVEQVYPHPGYRGEWSHDICLIKMKKKVKCNENISPICLPNVNYANFINPGDKVIVAGWGTKEEQKMVGLIAPNRVLHEAEMKIAPDALCKSQEYFSSQCYLLCIVPHQKQYTCHGDSGVPFIKIYNGQYFLVGIYNGRQGITCSDSPKIANSVPRHMKWIQRVTGITPDYPTSRESSRNFARKSRKKIKAAKRKDLDFCFN